MRRKSLYQEENDFQKRGIRLGLFWKMLPLLRPHIRMLVLCGFFLLSYSLLSVIGPLLIRHAIDVNFVEKDVRGLFFTVLFYTVTLIGSFFFAYYQRVKLEQVGQHIMRGVRERLFSKVSGFSHSYFDNNSVGTIISRIESDTEALRMLFTDTVVTLLGDLLLLFSMFVIMFVVHWALALVLFSIVPILFISIYFYNIHGAPLFLAVRRQTAEMYGFLEEYIRGMSIVQVFGRQKWVGSLLDEENRKKMTVDFRAEKAVILFINFIFFMNTVGTVLVLWFGSRWVMVGYVTLGTLIMFLAYIRRFFGPLFHLSEQLNVIQRAFAGAERIFNLLEQEPLIQSPPHPRSIHDGALELEFDRVWFAYTGESWVLQDVSFSVPAGERWALVGATGGGKTTIIDLLLRFYDPQRGRILLNGVDIREFDLDELRNRIGLVLQDIYLFPADVRENLVLDWADISDEQIFETLATVHAKEFVQSLPQGLSTRLAERGKNISLGERQLLSFARALLRNPSLLILDEATSSVDPMTERKIQQAMNAMLSDRTSLIIAHRLQTIVSSDVILVIHGGRLVEQGNHEKLIELRGLYHQLYHLQHNDHELALNS